MDLKKLFRKKEEQKPIEAEENYEVESLPAQPKYRSIKYLSEEDKETVNDLLEMFGTEMPETTMIVHAPEAISYVSACINPLFEPVYIKMGFIEITPMLLRQMRRIKERDDLTPEEALGEVVYSIRQLTPTEENFGYTR